MTSSDDARAVHDAELSVVSGITNKESTNTDNGLSIEQKKRKIDEIFLSQQWNDEDEYEVTKIRQVIRNHIFKHVKFVKGEGSVATNRKDNRSRQLKNLMFGKCHERPDLTRQSGYENQILKLVGLGEHDTSFVKRALWWKTYNNYIHQEIRQLRGRMNAGIKSSISEGNNDITYINIELNVDILTLILSYINRRC